MPTPARPAPSPRREATIEIHLDRAPHPAIAEFAGYEILGRLAVGGMAEVFLARERSQGGSARHVALKVIRADHADRPEVAAMFLQEGQVALGLTHPNLCHTLRLGTENGHPFLAMEHVAGITLKDAFDHARRAKTKLAPPVVAKIVATVAEALHSAHVARDERGRRIGIVHQDVSPQNVMIGHDGTVKLLDFGVASTARERASEPIESSRVIVRGKMAYLAPEQCLGVPIDPRADVFSLGIVLYEMLTGTRLFVRAKPEETLRAILDGAPRPWPESIPAPLHAVLDLALARERDERYASAAAMQEDLERFLAEGRHVVTSARIAAELARVLGETHGRPAVVETSAEAVGWLLGPQAAPRRETGRRETAPRETPRRETEELPIPLVQRRAPERTPRPRGRGALATLLGAAMVLAIVAGVWIGGTSRAGDRRPVVAWTASTSVGR